MFTKATLTRAQEKPVGKEYPKSVMKEFKLSRADIQGNAEQPEDHKKKISSKNNELTMISGAK